MLFSGWADMGRIVVVGVLAYTALLLFVRISGKRTLSKLNAFDFVITVALGSTLSSVVLDKTVSLAEGVLAIGLLILLQYGISWSTVRWGPSSGSSRRGRFSWCIAACSSNGRCAMSVSWKPMCALPSAPAERTIFVKSLPSCWRMTVR